MLKLVTFKHQTPNAKWVRSGFGLDITDVTFVAVGAAKAVDVGEPTMEGFIATLQPQIEAAA